jgi:hypothetical protein
MRTKQYPREETLYKYMIIGPPSHMNCLRKLNEWYHIQDQELFFKSLNLIYIQIKLILNWNLYKDKRRQIMNHISPTELSDSTCGGGEVDMNVLLGKKIIIKVKKSTAKSSKFVNTSKVHLWKKFKSIHIIYSLVIFGL